MEHPALTEAMWFDDTSKDGIDYDYRRRQSLQTMGAGIMVLVTRDGAVLCPALLDTNEGCS